MNKRDNFEPCYKQRLDLVQIECKDALEIIKWRDSPDTLFYLDPPYFNSDCGHYGGYTLIHFEALLKALQNIKGKFILSSYPSASLSAHMKDTTWRQITIESAISVDNRSGRKRLKTECLTMNF